MDKLIKDMSKYGNNNSCYELKIMDWGRPNLVAYTFNSYGEAFCKALFEALKEYKDLTLETGVSGNTMNDIIQHNVMRGLIDLLEPCNSDAIKVEGDPTERYYSYTFHLHDVNV